MEPVGTLHRLGSRCLGRSSVVSDPGPGSRPGFLGEMRIQAAAVSAFLRGEDSEDLMTEQIDQKRAEGAATSDPRNHQFQAR